MILEAILSSAGLSLVAGVGLGFAGKKFYVVDDPMAERLTKLLPGTNCGNCGFAGCKGYADALTAGDTPVNLCTPGGKTTMEEVAMVLGVEPKALDDEGPIVAFITEENCIGCTACIKACPVDAIVGANKQSHTVLVDWCTGCKKCVEPCPTKCIDMHLKSRTLYDWRWEKPAGPALLN